MTNKKKYDVEKLKKLGSEWEKEGYHRIYFNDLCELYGLELGYYNTGNISWASLDGEHISNSRARKIKNVLDFAKIYYDLNLGEFKFSGCDSETAKTIIAAIVSKHDQEI